ncbi:cobalt-factor II C(20)-methyltransferase [Vibrio sp. CAIM 722]|uniref:Cobalt-factor II C(20)-methyltransferase n=1 Tax=Vibrio eleionomae TaxID=2653505 RepID=A0A7X4LK14_9VIBR|nr:cobalt-factor II C(20)-methyltransferase [Vibrio eleionomae]MZI93362.1 cobalt-factor II C(20)-methyltransferase [Vibrio eleionomae]
MAGKLYAIGTGPGASDLITVRAARLLETLDVLYAPAGKKGGDSLALSIVREYLGEQVVIEERHFPMTADAGEKQAVWDQVAADIEQDVQAGKQVGFVTLGDSMLFSTWVFLLARLQGKVLADGSPLDMEMIPGISSYSCIASAAQFPLAMEQQSMAVMSCTAEPDVLSAALQNHECVVLMKVYGRFNQIRSLLAELGLLKHAVLMANASMATEITYRDLASVDEQAKLPYFSTIVVNRAWNA